MKRQQKRCVNELLQSFEENGYSGLMGRKMKFSGIGERDVYNPFLFELDGKDYVAARVEPREREDLSQIIFFIQENGVWYPAKNTPVFDFEQDPWITSIDGTIYLSSVRVYSENSKIRGWRTVFRKGENLSTLQEVFAGHYMMKNIVFTRYLDEKIPVFGRPDGKISFNMCDTIKEIPQAIATATIIEDFFAEGEWGGIGSIFVLENGLLGAYGHLACYMGLSKHYYIVSFLFNPCTREYSEMKILATRDNFPEGEFKNPVLKNVVYSKSLKRKKNGMAIMYVGLSDAESGFLEIADPFLSLTPKEQEFVESQAIEFSGLFQ